ncbi:uncharacterized protein Z520_00781 [Fonsecaea multimorphosa CBS 102226]|uniref:CENP-V/GFA domain-containing protein n=1 Tax=Fonsecaea multimorphosa CBS 102226 TaxID=1442371 RepID=A0A0D2L4U3_9EURO|nr:uncharacterized protein Z520_00781 [Fonsecaea multimorphosa CBS 102226]KIY04089.1 hypothetical protein Z520_00781 [Fonsecaea multimorphosa CBS 102226]OAL31922.1 hypothetical protein AYO22_00792 [Fonsecaea multimorphosa]
MEGRCQCGSVRFRTPQEKPIKWYICHCHECRRQSASAFGISAIFPHFDLLSQSSARDSAGSDSASSSAPDQQQQPAPDGGDTATRGESDLVGVYEHSRTTSGRPKKCYYCKKCGTRIMNVSVSPSGDASHVAIKGGCLEGIDGDIFSEATHIWTKSALVPIPEGAESYPEEPPPRA